jgi:penicillin-binding protein 1A
LAAPAFAFYYKKLLELYPDTKRTFDIPQGVYRGKYEGKSELYTQNSPLPNAQRNPIHSYDEGVVEKTKIVEDIDPEEGEIGMAKPINIDDTPTYDEDEAQDMMGDALHPQRKVPLTPVSNDSGELF